MKNNVSYLKHVSEDIRHTLYLMRISDFGSNIDSEQYMFLLAISILIDRQIELYSKGEKK